MLPPPDAAVLIAALARVDGSSGQLALDAHWRRLNEAGNRALERHDLEAALRLYGEALTEAERLFDRALSDGGAPILLAPMAHNIACHNAAEAKRKAGDDVGARGLKLHAVEKLVATASSAASPLALRVNCVRHLRYALANLAQDITAHEQGKDGIKDLVARAQAVAVEVFRIAEHLTGSGGNDEAFGSDRPGPLRSRRLS